MTDAVVTETATETERWEVIIGFFDGQDNEGWILHEGSKEECYPIWLELVGDWESKQVMCFTSVKSKTIAAIPSKSVHLIALQIPPTEPSGAPDDGKRESPALIGLQNVPDELKSLNWDGVDDRGDHMRDYS